MHSKNMGEGDGRRKREKWERIKITCMHFIRALTAICAMPSLDAGEGKGYDRESRE